MLNHSCSLFSNASVQTCHVKTGEFPSTWEWEPGTTLVVAQFGQGGTRFGDFLIRNPVSTFHIVGSLYCTAQSTTLHSHTVGAKLNHVIIDFKNNDPPQAAAA